MIYFISSKTVWPADKERSVNLIYVNQDRNGGLSWFGCNQILRSTGQDIVVTDNIENNGLICCLYDSNFEKLPLQLKVGDILQKDIFSFCKISDFNAIFRDEIYTDRAINFAELYEYNDTNRFFENFEKLIKISITNMKSCIDTFFIYLSCIPTLLLKDKEKFFQSFFDVLNNYPLETFVLIIDPISLNFLSCFSGLLENHENDFSSEIIVRVDCSIFNTTELREDQKLLFNKVIYTDSTKEQFLSFISRFSRSDIQSLLNNRFTKIIEVAKKDSCFNTYKSRLKQQIVTSNKYDVNFCTGKSLDSFINKYLANSITAKQKRRFLFCFQRLSVSFENKPFEIMYLGNEAIDTWSKLNTLMKKCRFTLQSHSDDYRKVKYICGKNKNQTGYSIPSNSAEFKYFIFDAAICVMANFDVLIECLGRYGFAFTRFSEKDLVYEFVIKDSNTQNECDKANLFRKLEILIK